MKLTPKQQEQLDAMQKNGPLYVSKEDTAILRTFDALVRKGYAVQSGETDYSRVYRIA